MLKIARDKLMIKYQLGIIILIGLICVFIIGTIDYIVVLNISLSICYLLPISIVTRYANRTAGIFLSISSAISWYICENYANQDLSFPILLWNTLVRFGVFIIVVNLLSELKKSYEREKYLARVDGLTKIYNRRYFLDYLTLEVKRSVRYSHSLTLVYFDVDNFKPINDVLGHAQGDQLLCLIATTIKKNLRETDVVARLGGDEFALLLPETDYEGAQLVLQRLRQKLLEAVKISSFDVGFSIGAVTFRNLPDSVDTMLEQVDRLMYQVKNSSKNAIKHQLWDYC
ncbi:MAG: hypothetical protein Tsb0014_31400 [Pleurocapsa sp.]